MKPQCGGGGWPPDPSLQIPQALQNRPAAEAGAGQDGQASLGRETFTAPCYNSGRSPSQERTDA